MFIEAIPAGRGKHAILINTDQIVSVESLLKFMDLDYRVSMSNGKQFTVSEREAKQQLRSLLYPDRQVGAGTVRKISPEEKHWTPRTVHPPGRLLGDI